MLVEVKDQAGRTLELAKARIQEVDLPEVHREHVIVAGAVVGAFVLGYAIGRAVSKKAAAKNHPWPCDDSNDEFCSKCGC